MDRRLPCLGAANSVAVLGSVVPESTLEIENL